MEVILKINTVYSKLQTEDEDLKNKFHLAFKFREKNYYHNPLYRQKKWDGFVNFFTLKTGQFLTGLLPEVVMALKSLGVKYEVVDERNPIDFKINKIEEDFLWDRHHEKPVVLRDYQTDLINQALANKRCVVEAKTGCHRIGQKILMYDGTLKCVEDIKIGDKLVGLNGQYRTVLSLCRGKGQMYEINPTNNLKPFVVNEDHILTLQRTICGTLENPNTSWAVEHKDELIDVSIKEWLNWGRNKKHQYKLFSSGSKFKRNRINIDPYLLGLLLGDGTLNGNIGVTTNDVEIKNFLYEKANEFKLDIYVVDPETSSSTYFFTNHKKRNNILLKNIKKLNLFKTTCENKFIPHCYKTSTKNNRLDLLAGLIDTDGSLVERQTGYDFISKSKQLTTDVSFVAKSLGLKVSRIDECIKSDQHGTEGLYYRIYIAASNEIKIPCKIPRKIITKQKTTYKSTRTGFNVNKLGIEDYYGFILDGDGRYLLEDFTVTHNSGKTNVLIALLKALPPKTPTLVLVDRKDLAIQNYDEIKKFGFNDVGLFYGEVKDPNFITVCVINSVDKLEPVFPRIKALFVDEIHDGMSKSFINVYKSCSNADIRIAFSATPFRYAGKDKCHKYRVKGYIGGVLKSNISDDGKLSTDFFQKRNILTKANCVFYTIDSPDRQYDVYGDALTYGIAQNPYLNQGIAKLVKEKLSGRTLLVVSRIEHGECLQQLIPNSFWLHGTQKKDVRKSIIKDLKDYQGDFVAIAVDSIINKGINVFIHNLVNIAGGKADHQVLQRLGRGLRTSDDKEILNYIDFYFTNNPYLEKHSEARVKILKTEGHPVEVKEDFNF